MSIEVWLGLAVTIGSQLVVAGVLYGVMRTRQEWLSEKLDAMSKRFDADIGRLNEKVNNDIHGRRAVQDMQNRLVRLEVRDELMHPVAAAKEAAA